MAFKVSEGNYVDYIIPDDHGAVITVKAGDVVSLNSNAIVGISGHYGVTGEKVPVWLDGRWKVAASSLSATLGAPAYWDNTNKVVTSSVPQGSTYPQMGVFGETVSSFTGNVTVVLGVPAITKTTAQ